MSNSSKKLLWDLAAAVLSVLFFECLVLNASFNPYINWDRVIFGSISGIVSYSVMLLLFRNKQKFIGIPMIVYSVILGSIIWALLSSMYSIYFDWRYLSDIRPESFYTRSLEDVRQTLLYFVPLMSINIFIFIGLSRLLKRAVFFTRAAKLP